MVYKIVPLDVWQSAPKPWPGSADDLRDGFVHLSTREQVNATHRKHFRGQTGLAVLAIDPERLPPGALRWEVSRGGAEFPHLYAPLPEHAVVEVLSLPFNTP